ncbi:PD-(D/E)XK nuclease-like domain-containing protein [Burkholderia pseudomallei]|uniref:PD-(D/E)XK nuclease-like domain-containing protein n=1 Tax=Burkholderia pseudomallei TaxID=28450 RepID=UPI0007182A8A|nr:PD-(D/E)XK nuclease-like domain-containing protein [Burkholderia pseudomallei]AUL54973.1 exonuclease VIII [Burkholderia pseudomallei]MBR7789848.1 PD-(D/E)XK nuclease-like domain-containing protein [Burkholderia pseudomallei]MCW0104450.1 PD-(D/E)XK nuclease-like domain-containing protein [Burkholderia pseudomallei]NAW76395.1 exonuclease VIII [Burkholderia pseudomallei]NAX70280.1 exonuclease VIII [Burkholderia pseudomallei]
MLIEHLDIDEYHARPQISKSQLDTINVSPAHFWALHRDPARPAPTTRGGQLEGNLAHCAILEPDEFGKRYALGPTLNRNTKAWKEFVDENAGRIAIQQDQYDTAWRQSDAVRALPEIREALSRGRAEVSAFWNDPATGVACRCRPDWVHDLTESNVLLVDLKTFSSAGPDEFRRQAARKRYHVQDAFYSDGYEAASGKEVRAFVFVAVETEWPFAAHAMMLDDMSREQGRSDYARNLATYARCEDACEWPGYSKEITLITLPQWAFTTDEA